MFKVNEDQIKEMRKLVKAVFKDGTFKGIGLFTEEEITQYEKDGYTFGVI